VPAGTHTVDDVSTLDIRELDRGAVALATGVVAQVRGDDLGRPTPCEGWTVRDLLRHMTAQHRGFAAAARGDGANPGRWVPPAESDADPVGAHQAAAADVVAAFAETDLDAAELTLPDFGGRVFPARQAMSFHAIDYLVHAWDVGASIGLPVRPDDDLLPAALDITLAVPVGDARTRPGAAFAPVLAGASAKRDPWQRVLATLGRDPDWRRPR
jgi:uncharacterized protein (TIGR03086 family)